jgi:hypothetical protein
MGKLKAGCCWSKARRSAALNCARNSGLHQIHDVTGQGTTTRLSISAGVLREMQDLMDPSTRLLGGAACSRARRCAATSLIAILGVRAPVSIVFAVCAQQFWHYTPRPHVSSKQSAGGARSRCTVPECPCGDGRCGSRRQLRSTRTATPQSDRGLRLCGPGRSRRRYLRQPRT